MADRQPGRSSRATNENHSHLAGWPAAARWGRLFDLTGRPAAGPIRTYYFRKFEQIQKKRLTKNLKYFIIRVTLTQKRNSYMKKFAVLLLFLSTTATANPYVEYKNELKYKETTFKKDIHHLRLGYKTKKNFYLEAGPRTEGYSLEAGYKVSKGKFVLKGKWEGSKTDNLDHKLETEVRYTFK